jgi:PQQ-like domain
VGVTKLENRVKAIIIAAVLVIAGIAGYFVIVYPHSSPTTRILSTASCPKSVASGGGNGTDGNWTTYHGNNSLIGGDELSGAVTGVAPTWPAPTSVNGQVYAEPLVCGDTVFVVTEEDSVYAVNATDGAIRWQTNLGTPVPSSALPCGDINPSGITSTPVIDVATNTLYVVAYLDLSPIQHVLFGLDITNGSVTYRVGVDPPLPQPDTEQQRGALALADGMVYIVYGGLYGDCGTYHGWVVGVPTNGSTTTINYEVPSTNEGGIWGASGIAVAANGDLFVSTGNSASTTTFDFGDSVIELSPSLKELQYFAPSNWAYLNGHDVDLGSMGPILLPNGDVFQAGKEGVGYLLSGTDLGGVGGQIYNESICAGAYGGAARVGNALLIPCTNGVVKLTVGTTSFSIAWQTSSFDAGSPIVTGNVVWAANISTGELMGFNFSTGQTMFSVPLGSVDHFITPAAAPGALFVAAGDELYSFTLTG